MKVIDYIKEHGIESLKENFNIVVSEYPDRIVLNYSQIDSPKFPDIVRECRGLILSLPDLNILSRSFDRFYNYGEDQNFKDFNILEATCFEKIDGSLCPVYFDGEKWNVQTRKMAFAEGETRFKNSFKDVFEKALGDYLNTIFEVFPKHFTYIFELVSPETRVVKPYKEYAVALLCIKNKFDGREFLEGSSQYENTLIWLKKRGVNVFTPKSYKFRSFDEVIENLKDLPAFDEGYVCVQKRADGSFWRIKVKNPSYLAIAHLRENGIISTKRMCELIFANDYDEYLLNFPEDRELFDPYINAFDKMLTEVQTLWYENKDLEVQKDFALKVKDTPVSSILFSLRKGLTMEEIYGKMSPEIKERILTQYKG